MVEGKDVQEKRSIYLLLNGQVSMDIGGKNVPNMVRGNFLGSARFMEEETLRALSEMRGAALAKNRAIQRNSTEKHTLSLCLVLDRIGTHTAASAVSF